MNVEYAFIRYACMYLGVESQDRKTHLSNMSLFFFLIINHSYKIGVFLFLFLTSIKVIC